MTKEVKRKTPDKSMKTLGVTNVPAVAAAKADNKNTNAEIPTLLHGKPLNRMNDVFAKFIFANEKRKDLTLDLINSVFEFEGTKGIVDFDFRDRELDPESEEGKTVVLDVTGRSSDNTLVNVEIQLHKVDGMEKRMLYYWSRLYSKRLETSEDYTTLNRTVVISILAYKLFDRKLWAHYHSSFAILNTKDVSQKLTDDLELHVVELPKLQKKAASEMTRLERWLAYLSPRTTDDERRQLAMTDTAIETALEAEKVFLADPDYMTAYERREKIMRDNAAMKAAAIKDGLAKGMAKGMAEGRLAEQKDLILKWHHQGKSDAFIAELLSKTEAEVTAIIQQSESETD